MKLVKTAIWFVISLLIGSVPFCDPCFGCLSPIGSACDITNATTLGLTGNVYATGFNSSTSGSHFYKLHGWGGNATITIQMGNSNTDYDLFVYDSGCNELCSSTRLAGLDDSCTYYFANGQLYFVRVDFYGGTAAAYLLRWTKTGASCGTSQSYYVQEFEAPPRFLKGFMPSSQSNHYYQSDYSAGQQLILRLYWCNSTDGPSNGNVPVAYILNDDCQEVACLCDTTTHELTFTVPSNPWYIRIHRAYGNAGFGYTFYIITPPGAADEQIEGLATGFNLADNYPNPFNPSTSIEFSVPKTSRVSLKIYNIMGQETATLVDEIHSAGVYRATWDGTNMNGLPVAAGVYIYRMVAGDFVNTKKMLLVK